MSGPRNIDSRREEFRKYLESSGVTDSLIRMMTSMYESDERPADALQFLRDQFIQSAPYIHELTAVQQYLDAARERIRTLESENAELREELDRYKPRKYSQ
ncbi:hypothetical protein V9T40_013700 [Parthenolecanium corni]|uniref:c-Myc-binding protein n=1 Tax=Parthenolecanium corni TaxID=536013 RepID=A0AAN9TBN7_9HEMI